MLAGGTRVAAVYVRHGTLTFVWREEDELWPQSSGTHFDHIWPQEQELWPFMSGTKLDLSEARWQASSPTIGSDQIRERQH